MKRYFIYATILGGLSYGMLSNAQVNVSKNNSRVEAALEQLGE